MLEESFWGPGDLLPRRKWAQGLVVLGLHPSRQRPRMPPLLLPAGPCVIQGPSHPRPL